MSIVVVDIYDSVQRGRYVTPKRPASVRYAVRCIGIGNVCGTVELTIAPKRHKLTLRTRSDTCCADSPEKVTLT